MVGAYRRILTGDDRAAQVAAAKAWSVWEGETIRLLPDEALSATHEGDDFALAFAGSKIIISSIAAGWKMAS